MAMDLTSISSPSFLKSLDNEQLKELSEDIRAFLIENLAVTGGHIGPNLGVVELTIALHKSFNSPEDKFLWDVGHQAYVHKILTGRRVNLTHYVNLKDYADFQSVLKVNMTFGRQDIAPLLFLLWVWQKHVIYKTRKTMLYQ